MKPLLLVAVVLSLAWVTLGAPQNLVNLTSDGVDKGSTPSHDASTSLPFVTSSVEHVKDLDTQPPESSTDAKETLADSESLSAEARGGTESTPKIDSSSDETLVSTEKSLNAATEAETSTTAHNEASKTAESVSTTPVSHYVPPIDPVKHMMMMADIKNAAKISPALDAVSKSQPSTTRAPTTAESSTEAKVFSSEVPDVNEKVEARSSEEKLETPSSETMLDEATTVKLFADSKETEYENVVSVTESVHETTGVSSSTEESSSSVTSSKVTLTDSSETGEREEESAPLLKNSAEDLKVDPENITARDVESETTSIVFSTTAEALKVESTTDSTHLVKNIDDLKVVKEVPEKEITTSTTESGSSTELEVESKNGDGPDEASPESAETVLTSNATTDVPETTFESSSVESPEAGPKNASLEEDLEFRAVKIPVLNESKVSYVERRRLTTLDPYVSEPSSVSFNDKEITTENIITTIAELLTSTLSSTEIPVSVKEHLTTLQDKETTEAPLSVDESKLSDVQGDSVETPSIDESDLLKFQSIKDGLESTSTSASPVSESTTSDKHPEVLQDDPSVEVHELEIKDAEPPATSDDVQEETIFTSTEKASTTTERSTTEESDSSTESKSDETKVEYVESSSTVADVAPESTTEENRPDHELSAKDRYVSGNNSDMVAAVQFLHYHDKASSEQCFKLVDAHWNYATNLTEENKKKQLEQTLAYSLFHKDAWKNATSFAWKSFNDTLLRRWFKSLSVLGTAALPEDKLNEFNKIKAEMKNTYSTAKICAYVSPQAIKKGTILTEKDCGLALEPDLVKILTKSRNYEELVHIWKSWRDSAGKPIRDKYIRFVNLSNEAARLNGFSDTGDMWREAYESETFEKDLEALWQQLKPLYQHLHAYVRRRLINLYGEDKIKEDGPIPAHLFGNMWAQSWISLLDITQPFSGKPSVDVTPNMENKNMTALEMFKIAEEFFISLGLKPMPEPFWKHSLIEKPNDREIICHASAWDFCNGKDYRIKQCAVISMDDLVTVHHEMGHVQYFLQYARQPNVFREGANPGFHEAIGDVLALSVSTPKHLKSIGLLDEVSDDPEGDLNFLLYTALDKVAFLPSGYLIDLWRWGLFSGDIKPEEMNSRWWELRLKYQGICPPVRRTDSDFDPGAKFHVPGNVPYVRYFVSFIIQFQFHKVLCDAAGHTGPLYKCDIYRSKEAGQILSQVMELGSSEHWSEAMKIMTGGATSKMDAGPILEYFKPLLEYLQEQNKNETLGWHSGDPTICP